MTTVVVLSMRFYLPPIFPWHCVARIPSAFACLGCQLGCLVTSVGTFCIFIGAGRGRECCEERLHRGATGGRLHEAQGLEMEAVCPYPQMYWAFQYLSLESF